MNNKKFEFTDKDIPYLKRDIVVRTIFSVLFISIFVWQFIMMVQTYTKASLDVLKITSSLIVLICSLMLSFISLMYVFRNFRILTSINEHGRCVSYVQMLIKTNKRSFIWMYGVLIQFLTLVTSLVLICSLTYSILQVAYMSSISFFLPFLLMVCVSGYNSIYHIKDEMHIQNSTQEYYNA